MTGTTTRLVYFSSDQIQRRAPSGASKHGDGVETHRGDAQQKAADAINLLRHPLAVNLSAPRRGAYRRKAATFIICRFSFRRSETAIGIFLIDHPLQPCVVHRGFRAEHDDMECMSSIYVRFRTCSFRQRFATRAFALFRTGDNKVPRLGIALEGCTVVVFLFLSASSAVSFLLIERLVSSAARRQKRYP